MTSTTPYKDELIRVAAILGLPDDTDLSLIGEAVAALKAEAEQSAKAARNTLRLHDFQRDRGDAFREALEDAATAMEKARDDLRLKAGSDLVGARATMVRVADDLNLAAQAADDHAAEPVAPDDAED
jgi:predicted phage gp36 major capsid-like protein